MKADAIRRCAAAAAADTQPSDADLGEAVVEIAEIALGFFANVTRIADAAEQVARCVNVTGIVDHAKDASFATHNLSEITGHHH